MGIKNIFNKTTLTIACVVIAGLFVWSTSNLRSKLSAANAKLSSTEVLLSIVDKEKARLDSLKTVHLDSIAKLDVVIGKLNIKIAKNQQALEALQDSLDIVNGNTQLVTADSSYSYINLRIPPLSELIYKFDSLQVKHIHFNFIERDGLLILNNKKDLIIKDLNLSSYAKDNQIVELKALNNVYLSKEAILQKEKESLSVEIQGLNKTLGKQKFQKFVSEGALLGVVGVILIKALLK